MAKIEIEVSDDILKFVDEQGYEITSFDHPEEKTPVLQHLRGELMVGPYIPTPLKLPMICVRRKPKYRPAVAPMDLGKVCEFSDARDFEWSETGELASVEKRGTRPAYRPARDGRWFRHARILESDNGTT